MEGGVQEFIAEFIKDDSSYYDMSRYGISVLFIPSCQHVAESYIDRMGMKDIPSTAAALSFKIQLQPKSDNCRAYRETSPEEI